MKSLIQARKHKTLQALKHKNSAEKIKIFSSYSTVPPVHPFSSKEGKLLYNLRNNYHIVGCYINSL